MTTLTVVEDHVGLTDETGEERFHPTVRAAVAAAEGRSDCGPRRFRRQLVAAPSGASPSCTIIPSWS